MVYILGGRQSDFSKNLLRGPADVVGSSTTPANSLPVGM